MADLFYNLQQVAAMLTTTRMTLRKWLLEEGMKTRVNPGNEKERQLSWEQITVLAAAKRRILPADPSTPAADPLAALEARLRSEIRRLDARIAKLEQERLDAEQPTIKMPALRAPEAPQTALPAAAPSLPIQRQWPAESHPGAQRLLTVLQFVERHLIDEQHLNAALVDATSQLHKESRSTIGRGARVKLLEHWRTRKEPGVQRCREGCECVDYLPG